MDFEEMIARLRAVSVELEHQEIPDFIELNTVLNLLCTAADEGRIVEVPLTGDGETIEVPNLATAKMPKVTP